MNRVSRKKDVNINGMDNREPGKFYACSHDEDWPLRMTVWSRRAVLGGALAFSCGPVAPARAAGGGLRRGVNTWPWFALTREYPAPSTDYAWPPFQEGRAVPRPVDLAALATAGFDFIRIPVDPGPFLAFGGARRAALLQMLTAAVAEGLAAGLSVVVNIQANAATHFWTPDHLVASQAAPGFDAYRTLVADVAARLSDFDPARVALEPVNEPPQGCVSAEWVGVQTALFAAARTVAPHLALVATGGCGSMVSGLVALDPAPLLALGNVRFTFHFYEPYLFSHQGAPWMREPVYRDLNAVPWPASAGSLDRTLAAVRQRMAQDTGISEEAKRSAYRETERALTVYFAARPDLPFIEGYFAKVQAWAARHGVPADRILLGEFGALRSDARYVASGAADRARYVHDVRVTAEKFGYPGRSGTCSTAWA